MGLEALDSPEPLDEEEVPPEQVEEEEARPVLMEEA